MDWSQPAARWARALLAPLTLVLVVVGGWLVWQTASYGMPLPEQEQPASEVSSTAHEMVVANVAREQRSGDILLVLQERGRERYLVLTIGPAEAVAIALPIQGEVPERPLTHDLMASMLDELGAQVVRVVVTDFHDSIYYAQLVLRVDGREIELDSRPSDAIALALRAQAPIYAEADVLERAGLTTEQPF
jgi:bifunctional DNase/RNase